MAQAANKQEFIKAYQWHIAAFDYLQFSDVTTTECAAILKAQRILDDVVRDVAKRQYGQQ